MKHLLFIIFIVIAGGFIKAKAQDVIVSQTVKSSFENSFAKASNVKWSQVNDLYAAQFNINEIPHHLFYNQDGQLIAIAKFISINNLSESLKADLNKKLGGSLIKEIFEISGDDDSIKYFVTLENNNKACILESDGNHWKYFRRVRK